MISYFVYLYVHHLDISQYPSKIFFSAFHRRVSLGEGPAGQLAENCICFFVFPFVYMCVFVFVYMCVFVFVYCTFGTMEE